MDFFTLHYNVVIIQRDIKLEVANCTYKATFNS